MSWKPITTAPTTGWNYRLVRKTGSRDSSVRPLNALDHGCAASLPKLGAGFGQPRMANIVPATRPTKTIATMTIGQRSLDRRDWLARVRGVCSTIIAKPGLLTVIQRLERTGRGGPKALSLAPGRARSSLGRHGGQRPSAATCGRAIRIGDP